MIKTSLKNQYLAALIGIVCSLNSSLIHISSIAFHFNYYYYYLVNLFSVIFGATIGWASPSVILLTSANSPLPSGRINLDEASWIASLFYIGSIVGNYIFGLITNQYGRKIPLIAIALLTIVIWLLILFAQNVYYLYAARILDGLAMGSGFFLVPLFLSEIANDR